MVTGGEDTTDAAQARLVLWGGELDEVLKILPKKPVDVVALALEKEEGMSYKRSVTRVLLIRSEGIYLARSPLYASQ